MYFILLFLVLTVSLVKASLQCPFPDYPICGSDGITYGNVCEWKLRTLFRPGLRLRDLGPCNLHSYYQPFDKLLRATVMDTGTEQILRSKKEKKMKRKGRKHKLRKADSIMNDLIKSADILDRLAAIPFNFRRNYQGQENKELYK